MFAHLKLRSFLIFGSGLGVGLLVGVGMLVGALVATSRQPSIDLPINELKMKAMATHGGESFAMATGFVGDGMEGVFFLDYLTGDLKGFVLNSRTGGFGAGFKTNVAADLGVEKGKKPSFLMTTGMVNFRTGGNVGGKKPADCVVYVCDTHTGNFAAYSIPYNIILATNGGAQIDTFVKLASGKARELQDQP
jgi:hypothetical protein